MKSLKNIWFPKRIGLIHLELKGEAPLFTAYVCGKDIRMQGTYTDLEALISKVGKNRAYHLHVTGSGVLHRKVESLPNFRDQLIIGGNTNDFYFTAYDDGTDVAASFVRREAIRSFVELFEEKKWHQLGISSGEIPVCGLDENVHYQNDFRIELAEGKLAVFERNAQLPKREDPDAICRSLQKNYTSENPKLTWELCTEAVTNFKEFNQFRTLGLSLVSLIFIALFGNYFYQNALNQDIAQLEADLSLSNENIALLDRLEQEKVRKEQLIASAGVTSSRFLSYYLDEIGRTVPKSVKLQELTLFPLDGKLKNKQKVTVQSDHISLQGTTPDNEILDDWIELMDRFEWVKSIELLHYGKINDTAAEFKLLITTST